MLSFSINRTGGVEDIAVVEPSPQGVFEKTAKKAKASAPKLYTVHGQLALSKSLVLVNNAKNFCAEQGLIVITSPAELRRHPLSSITNKDVATIVEYEGVINGWVYSPSKRRVRRLNFSENKEYQIVCKLE